MVRRGNWMPPEDFWCSFLFCACTLGSAATLGSVRVILCLSIVCLMVLLLGRFSSCLLGLWSSSCVNFVTGCGTAGIDVGAVGFNDGSASWNAYASSVNCFRVCVPIGGTSGLSSVLYSAAVRSFASAMMSTSLDAEGIRNSCGNHLTCCTIRSLFVCRIHAR